MNEEHRSHLFGVAYRMLGTIADAEDVVQETWLRWLRRGDHDDVDNPRAFLTTTATRLALDRLRARASERKAYDGMWLPEPLVDSTLADQTELASSLTPAFLVLLETLAPIERAAFILRDVFELDYAEIAGVIEKGESNCRQICKRARERIKGGARFTASASKAAEIAHKFFLASASGDVDGVISLLRADVLAWSDHGGKAAAARNTISGADAVARYMVGAAAKFTQGMRPQFAEVNGVPGLILFDGDKVHAVLFVELDGEEVARVGVIRNPEKLGHIT